MDTRKITLIATIAVIALIAVGVGYAYTATTQNSGNNAQGEYVTLTQTGTGAYKFTHTAESEIANIYYDTINTATGTSYRLASQTTDIQIDTAHYACVPVGSEFVIKATGTNANTTTGMTCAVDCTGFNAGNNWVFILKTVTAETTPVTTYMVYNGTWSGNTFTIASEGGVYKDTTVTVYFGYNVNTIPTAPNDKPLMNASLVFTATHNGSYTGDLFNINLIQNGGNGTATLNKYSSAAGQITLTARPANGYAARVKAMETDGTTVAVSPGQAANTFTFNVVDCDVDVIVTFVAEYTASATATEGTAVGPEKAYADSSYEATFTPTGTNVLSTLSVTINTAAAINGVDYTVSTVGTTTTVTIIQGHVTGNVVITATY